MTQRMADKALFRRAGKLRDQGKSPSAIARELGVSRERVAQLIFKYDHTVTNIEHGTQTAYQYYGCHCVECVSAATSRGSAYRDKLRAHPERVKHGTFTAYFGVGCRCKECKAFGDPQVQKSVEPIAPPTRQGELWTDEELMLLGDYSKTAKELGAELGRTPVAIKAKRRQMWQRTFAS